MDELGRRVQGRERTDTQAAECITLLDRRICRSLHALSERLIAYVDMLINRVTAAPILLTQIDRIARQTIALCNACISGASACGPAADLVARLVGAVLGASGQTRRVC